MRQITASVITHSTLLYNGLSSLLRKTKELSLTFIPADSTETIVELIDNDDINVVFVDSSNMSLSDVEMLRNRCGDKVKLVEIQTCVTLPGYQRLFDVSVSIYESAEGIINKVAGLFSEPVDGEHRNELTAREKEIVKGVVMGLSNKEIASEMNISTHTVMTHRRNIASKLQIHSPAGLTIYAIARKLVQLNEVAK